MDTQTVRFALAALSAAVAACGHSPLSSCKLLPQQPAATSIFTYQNAVIISFRQCVYHVVVRDVT